MTDSTQPAAIADGRWTFTHKDGTPW
jgi:hypothetical protein